jgi:predicted porin
MASGVQSGSRLGFKGVEDLGNGLKAIWQLENSVVNDSNAGGAAGTFGRNIRNAYLGLTGSFGTAVAGRLDGVRYGVYNKYDAFAGGGIGNFTQMTLQVDRADNAIAYISPTWSGFTLVLAHARDTTGNEANGALNYTGAPFAAGSARANTGDGLLYTIETNYTNGPISADIGYETVRYKNHNNAAQGGLLDKEVVYYIAGSYDFGFLKLRALWDHHRAEGSKNYTGLGAQFDDVANYNAWFVSATVPYGNFLFKATYGRVNDKLNNTEAGLVRSLIEGGDASKWGIGVNYNLSKRTNVYLDYGHISNSGDATHAISYLPNSASTTYGLIGNGYGVRGWNIGMAHNF